MHESRPAASEQVTVCICTFRRSSIFAAIDSVADQAGVVDQLAAIAVIDNDETDSLRQDVEAYAARIAVPLSYMHAPAKNISIARNAALQITDTKWLAFIDDDEAASTRWLAALISRRGSAEVVVGVSRAVYGEDLPPWVARCDFHSNEVTGSPVNAYTSSVLLDLSFVETVGTSFREELGTTGGEDTYFFRELAENGARFVYAPEAIVYEPVPPGRATMRWVARRMYRAGQTHALVSRQFAPSTFRALWMTAPVKMIISAIMALLTLPGTDVSRKWFARACLHAGATHFRIRPGLLEEYA